ncbi:M16 family metallopeptidase [Bacteroidota bacterium]
MLQKLISKLFFLALIVLISFSANAQPEVKYKSLDENIPLDPKITFGKLDNGITYYIRENKKPENRTELQMVIKAGSLQEDDDQAGLAHFIEHMCFNGTKNFPKNDLIKFLESLGMRFGGDLNASTGFDRTYYMLTIPMDKPGILDSGFQVLEDWLHNVTFDPEELEKERGVITEEWRLYRGANERIMRKHLPNILYKSRYADRLPIGDTTVIINAPRKRFLDFYNDWYRTDITAIIAVGDFDKNEVEKIIKERFGKIKKLENAKKHLEYEIPAHKKPITSIAIDKEWPYSLVQLYFKHEGKQHPTFKNYRQSLVDRLMSTMLSERLSELTHKPDPPYVFANAIETHFMSNLKVFSFTGMVKETGFQPGIEAMLTEAFRAMQHGFTQTELDRAKKEQMRFIEKAYNERDKTESARFAREYARNFNENEAAPGIEFELEIFKLWIPEITLVEINALIKKLITKDNLVITISAPEKEGVVVPAEEEIFAIYDKISKQKVEAYVDKVSDSPLFDKKVRKGRIVNEEENKELGITTLKLSNGVKVVLKPTDFKNDEILFQAYSPGGSSQVIDADYLSASVSDGLVDDGGIGEIDIVTLQKMLSGKIVRVSPYVGVMTEGLSGSSTPEDLQTMFELIHLYFTSPRKDDEVFQSYMIKLKEQIKNSKLDPRSTFNDTVNYTMSSYHNRSRPWTEELLSEINYDKAFAIYQDRFSDASDFTFVLVGSFKIDEIKPMIQKYLGSLPSLKRVENGKDIGKRYPKGIVDKAVKKGIEKKSSVRLVFTGDFEWNEENKFDLTALIGVLNIKMREAIREDKGGTYGIYSRGTPTQFPIPTYRIDIGFGTDPERVEELMTTLLDLIKEMQSDEVDETYIQKVKEIQKRQHEVKLKENRYWLREIYNDLYNGDDLANILKLEERVDKLTADVVLKAAKKYFKWDNYAKFVLYPED